MTRRSIQTMRFLCLAVACIQNSYAVDHSMHGGSSGGGSSSANCVKANFTEFKPEHLATVTPGSEFSFYAFNVENPQQIEVTVKSEPVAITTEERGNFLRIVGKLPTDISHTAARINIKYTAKMAKCSTDEGWLVTVTQ